MLLPRFITALIGVPLLLAAIWWGQIPFVVLLFGICMLSLHEYYTLAEESSWPVSKRTGLLCGAFLALTIFMFGTKMGWQRLSQAEKFFSPVAISIVLTVLALEALFAREKETAFLRISVTLTGVFYVIWTLSHLALIRDLRPDGKLYTFFFFFVIWAMDVGAYGGGMKFGRTKLTEISPKKTWEGVLAGLLCALLTGLVCRATFLKSLSVPQAAGLAVLVAGLAQLSDLSESLFKRNVQVKDSGGLLPGHGGILDRFDSFLLTSPVYYYILVLFIKP